MILSVESSCDESALAFFDPSHGIAGEWVHTQIELHSQYGGVVPDLASREHLTNFTAMLEQLPKEKLAQVQQIAVTRGPGLAGCLAMGVSLAKAAALALAVPVYGVNHLRAHAYSPFISLHEDDPNAFPENFKKCLPHLGLIVSGGNTLLFELEQSGRLILLGQTLDDAAGEALDKGAKLLGLPYPGGPAIEKLAAQGAPKAHDFPQANPKGDKPAFSFSGLKTSLRYRLEAMSDADVQTQMNDLCASYQAAVIGQLAKRVKTILKHKKGHYQSLGLSGGVANNKALRSAFSNLSKLPLITAEPKHTGDNAGMIAFAAWMEQAQLPGGLDLLIEPALPLTEH